MKKVRLFVNGSMTVIDLGQKDCYVNFHSFDCDTVVANVEKIVDRNGMHDIYTDFINPCRTVKSVFNLSDDNFVKVRWVE